MKNEKVNAPEKEIQVSLKDGTRLELITFGKRDKELKVRTRSGKGDVEVPRYVYFSKSCFGYDQASGSLVKNCRKCGAWFVVSRLSIDGIWEELHKENEVHFDGIRFRSDCTACHARTKVENADKEEKKVTSSKTDKSSKPQKSSNSGKKKISLHMFSDDYKYLQILAIEREVNAGDVLAEIIEEYRKRH